MGCILEAAVPLVKTRESDESSIRHLYGTPLYVSYRRGFRGGRARRPPPFRAIMIREGGGLFPVDLSV